MSGKSGTGPLTIMLVVGEPSGDQLGAQLMAARAVRRFEEVRVFSPRAESRAAFAAQFRDVTTVDSLEACVSGADVILAATSSTTWTVC